MLQENGIEDFRPLDVSMETEGYPYEGEKYKNGNDQLSVSDSNKDEEYGLRDMPEYNVETKADFKGNQEAIDWLMKDPNDFNVKSFEDSSELGDTDSFSQSSYSTYKEKQHKTENNAISNFHHRSEGRKKYHDSSLEDNIPFGHPRHTHSVQGYDQDDTSNHISAESRHLAKTTTWREKYDDYQDPDYSENDMGQKQQSWDSFSDGVDDSTSDRSYDEYDGDTKEYDEQRPRATSIKNLKNRIENQDAKLYKELEDFTNTDNYQNNDDTENLGDLNAYDDGLENLGTKYEDMENNEEEVHSNGEDNNSISNGKISDRHQQRGDRGRNVKWEDGESAHTNDQSDSENSDNDLNNEVNSDGSGTVSDNKMTQNEEMDEADDNDKENSNSKSITSALKIANIKANHANNKEKFKEMKSDSTHNTRNNEVIQNTDSLPSDEKNIDKSQEERITDKSKDTQTTYNEKENLDYNNKTVHEKTSDLKNKNEMDIPTHALIMSTSTNVDSLNINDSGQTKVIQAHSDAQKVPPVSFPKNVDEIGKGSVKSTGEEHLTPNDKPKLRDSNEKQPMLPRVKDIHKDMEQKADTKLYAAREKPTLHEKIKIQLRNGQRRNYRNDKKPTSTGFRRNQQSYNPLSGIYSLADLKKIENIISYLRGTGSPRSAPTRSSKYTPTTDSLKNLYYYPLHPTPQEQSDDILGVKGKCFNIYSIAYTTLTIMFSQNSMVSVL